MRLDFLGATHEVTGSCTLIEANGKFGLVDCGMEQGKDIFVNQQLPVYPEQIDFVLLTHAHIDHCGNLPLLFKYGFTGLVYATSATCNLCEIMLRDCAHIQENDAERQNRKNIRAGKPTVEPLFTEEDVAKAISHFRPCEYGKLTAVDHGIAISFVDAGHLMGSASIEVYLLENEEFRKVVFSGDIGNYDQPLIKDPQYIETADYVITESTYGNRLHKKPPEGNVEFLARCIRRTLNRGGNVVIPAFAVGRTQELLYFFREIKVKGLVDTYPDFKIVLDSPMATETTGIFLQCDREYFDAETCKFLDEGINPLMSPEVEYSVSTEESRKINSDKTPKIIIASSGMCEGGRIRHHLKYNLWRPESTILFVGYQAYGTLGRRIADGADKVEILGDEVACNAEIAMLTGKSGHADKDGLIKWITSFKMKPKHVFINHGDDHVCMEYAECLEKEYGFNVSVPYSGSIYNLLTEKYEKETVGIPVKRQEK